MNPDNIDINTVSDRVRALDAQGSLEGAHKLGKYLLNALRDDGAPRVRRLKQIAATSGVPYGRLEVATRVARGLAMLPNVSVKDLHYVSASHFASLPITEGPDVLREWLTRIDLEKLTDGQLRRLRRSLPTTKGGTRKKRLVPSAVKATRKLHKVLSDATRWNDLSAMTTAERKELKRLLPEMEQRLQDLIVQVYSE